jgi:hypothetical protein
MKKLLCLASLLCFFSIGCSPAPAPSAGGTAGPESTPGYGESMMQAGQGTEGAAAAPTETKEAAAPNEAAAPKEGEAPATEPPK